MFCWRGVARCSRCLSKNRIIMRVAAHSLDAARCARSKMSAFAHLYTSTMHVHGARAWRAPKRRLKNRAEADVGRKKFFSQDGAHTPISDRFAQKCANLRDVYRTARMPRSAPLELACNRKPIKFRVELVAVAHASDRIYQLRYRSTSAKRRRCFARQTFRVLACATQRRGRRVAQENPRRPVRRSARSSTAGYARVQWNC